MKTIDQVKNQCARYTREEIDQIQSMISEGLTNRQIATRLGRPEAGIRNIRYRLNMKANRKESLKQLNSDRISLSEKVNRLKWNIHSLNSRKKDIEKALQADEATLNTRRALLHTYLNKRSH